LFNECSIELIHHCAKLPATLVAGVEAPRSTPGPKVSNKA
jgi:hypothetical protein